MSAAPDWAAVARRVWRGTSWGLKAVRVALLVPGAAYRSAVALRNGAYDLGLLRSHTLPLPSVGVGNLAVGGTGKTPVASFFARELCRRGARPGILLRGYRGGDEAAEHAARVSEAVVVSDPDRRRGAARAAREGATALVLDDCLQRRDVRPDVLLAVLAAERVGEPMWPLPAGPWREGLGALARCDGVVVTCKSARPETAAAASRRLAPYTRLGLGVTVSLGVARFVPLVGGAARPAAELSGRAVVAVCGVGEPELFASQLESLGLVARLVAFGDHHAYTAADVAAVAELAGPDGLVLTTAKDAVKLRPLWPAAAPACLVAELEVHVLEGEADLARLLDRVARPILNPVAAGVPRERRNPR